MGAEVKTQGTELFVASGGSEIVKLVNVSSATGFGGPSNDIDVTNFDSSAMEFLQGLEDPGTASIETNVAPTAAANATLWDLKESKTLVEWCVGYSNGVTLPTAAAGVITAPAAPRSSLVFSATVQQFTQNFAANDVVRGQVQLRISGALTATWEAGSPTV